jgi:hypothetical protein
MFLDLETYLGPSPAALSKEEGLKHAPGKTSMYTLRGTLLACIATEICSKPTRRGTSCVFRQQVVHKTKSER